RRGDAGGLTFKRCRGRAADVREQARTEATPHRAVWSKTRTMGTEGMNVAIARAHHAIMGPAYVRWPGGLVGVLALARCPGLHERSASQRASAGAVAARAAARGDILAMHA